jgi:hypothetical protein
MTYQRVIPRDLFNDANLLKCYGQIYLNLEILNLPGVVFEQDEEVGDFSIVQCEDDGSTYISNVTLYVNSYAVYLRRPMNSREPWPLYATTEEGEELSVFNDDGTFTDEMLSFLKGE